MPVARGRATVTVAAWQASTGDHAQTRMMAGSLRLLATLQPEWPATSSSHASARLRRPGVGPTPSRTRSLRAHSGSGSVAATVPVTVVAHKGACRCRLQWRDPPGGRRPGGPASRKQHRALEPASDSESTVTGKLQVEARASLSAELRLPIKLHPAAQAARGMPRGRHGAGGQGHA